jgi:hypothetical protein
MFYKIYISFVVLIFTCVFATSNPDDDFDSVINKIASPLRDSPEISDIASTNLAILSSYNAFKEFLSSSQYFCSHNNYKPKGVTATSVHPVLEYMAFLVSLSSDTKIANILDHLIKTAGPFGFSERKANSAERVIYHIAMNAVAKTQGEPLKIGNREAEKTSFDAIQTMHPDFCLDLPTSEERWNVYLDALQHSDFFKPSAAVKISFLNDVFLLGYLNGITPRYKDDQWLSSVWSYENNNLERVHDFIQWIFPNSAVGVDPTAPLLTPTSKGALERHLPLLQCIRKMVRNSFARMANFWGQQINSSVALVKTSDQWHENWLNHTHNNPRMNRILECLSFLGMQPEFDCLRAYLWATADEADRTKIYPSLKLSRANFWANVPRPT